VTRGKGSPSDPFRSAGRALFSLGLVRGTDWERGPGAVVHAHPPGTVPDGAPASGEHGVYVFATSLERTVELAMRQAREDAT
jgi:hypothetical protein